MQIKIYTFPHAPEIYANTKGEFFRASDDRPIPKVYHAGRIAVRDRGRIYGIKRLRKTATPATRQITDYPL